MHMEDKIYFLKEVISSVSLRPISKDLGFRAFKSIIMDSRSEDWRESNFLWLMWNFHTACEEKNSALRGEEEIFWPMTTAVVTLENVIDRLGYQTTVFTQRSRGARSKPELGRGDNDPFLTPENVVVGSKRKHSEKESGVSAEVEADPKPTADRYSDPSKGVHFKTQRGHGVSKGVYSQPAKDGGGVAGM
ncbi:hypothetical protein HOLleu_14741 [Holothuria leucospilota]|uniref:Uncharacterized protein n=1 Tax=Holothuria leucospilota TaxID=206669 RepID=A0A9Q1C9C9_HOLLE|nr:hypothetical protein HOLleu_14741 [Holothuria leucospilota]